MRCTLAGIVAVLASAALTAADFWEEKDFTTGFGGTGGAGRDSDGGDGGFSGVRRITATVAWISALPVRQAIARIRAGVDAPVLAVNAFALDDKEVEFVTKMGVADIANKFTLADMVVRGRLAL